MSAINSNILSFDQTNFSSLISQVRTPPYYYRNVGFDHIPLIPDCPANQFQRVAIVALSILCLYKPAERTASLVLDSLRCVSGMTAIYLSRKQRNIHEYRIALLNTAFATAALGLNVLSHPCSLLVTTIHDIGISVRALKLAIESPKRHHLIPIITAKLVNSLLYLALFATGSVEILALSLISQVLTGAYGSYKNIERKDYLLAVSSLLITGIRCNQLAPQLRQLQIAHGF